MVNRSKVDKYPLDFFDYLLAGYNARTGQVSDLLNSGARSHNQRLLRQALVNNPLRCLTWCSALLNALPNRGTAFMTLRFVDLQTMREIAAAWDISPERVRQLQNQYLDKLNSSPVLPVLAFDLGLTKIPPTDRQKLQALRFLLSDRNFEVLKAYHLDDLLNLKIDSQAELTTLLERVV